MPTRNTELKALCDPPCALDEMRFGLGWADLPSRLLEQSQPTIEMIGIDRQREMFGHWAAVIAP